jgi:hypothetical protein
MNDERGDGAQMGVASGWVGLSVRRVVGFGERVRGGKGATNGWETDKRMEDNESLNPLIR